MFSGHNSYSDCFLEGKAENEIENSKENSTLVSEMSNSECFTPERLCVTKNGFEVTEWRGDPLVPGCAGEIWNEVPHQRKHALGRRGSRSKAVIFPRHPVCPLGGLSFAEPCGAGLDQDGLPAGGFYAPPPGILPALGRTVIITCARSRPVMPYVTVLMCEIYHSP